MTQDIQPPKATRSRGAMDTKMLELLVCPLTYGPLKFDPAKEELISERANLAYPVRDGIPIMLVSEARQLPEED
ncbi:Trm112 family protein [uncultured Hoeflea sp.]|uniref:Trm112 family protein n=1 Tax=uncultured Hoeflea sp. TaxID=538666 RepID=UPI0030DDB093